MTLTADDFRIDVNDNVYRYLDVNSPEDNYFELNLMGHPDYSEVALIRPGNISHAPLMIVHLNNCRNIILPKSVDCWDISYREVS